MARVLLEGNAGMEEYGVRFERFRSLWPVERKNE